jgi:hypothetical protein
MAPGSMWAAGWVPAEAAGRVLARRHSAAARCERAQVMSEQAVQVPRPPVLLGVQGKGAIERVVDYAGEWMPLDDEPAQRPR